MESRILIVDDSKTYLAFASNALQDAGFDVYMAESIWISRLLFVYRPDLVLMDVNIGSANGASAVSAIKKRSFGAGVKILLHSSRCHNELSQISEDCGADGFISKDGNAENLAQSVKKALGFPEIFVSG